MEGDTDVGRVGHRSSSSLISERRNYDLIFSSFRIISSPRNKTDHVETWQPLQWGQFQRISPKKATLKETNNPSAPQISYLMKGVEELYLCAGLVGSTMDF